MNARRNRFKLGISFLGFWLVSGGILSSLEAAIPDYKTTTEVARKIWADRFPTELNDLVANPEKKGVLTAVYNRKNVYYYFFQGKVPILHREEKGSTEMKNDGFRTVTFWLRYRPEEEDPYDLTFARTDLLPGTNKRWIRM